MGHAIQSPQPIPDFDDIDAHYEGLKIAQNHRILQIDSPIELAVLTLAERPQFIHSVGQTAEKKPLDALKIAAFHALSTPELSVFYGCSRATDRRELYDRCRDILSTEVRQYWDTRLQEIDNGLYVMGPFFEWANQIRKWVLPVLLPQHKITQLMELDTVSGRSAWWNKTHNPLFWRIFFRVLLSTPILMTIGIDRKSRHDRQKIANILASRLETVVSQIGLRNTPLLQWLIFGFFTDHYPTIFTESHHEVIRNQLDKIQFYEHSLGHYIDSAEPRSIDRIAIGLAFDGWPTDRILYYLSGLRQLTSPGGRLAISERLTDPVPLALEAGWRYDSTMTQRVTLHNRALHYTEIHFFYTE